MNAIAVHHLNRPASLYDLAELVSRLEPEFFRCADSLAFLLEHPVAFDSDAARSALAYARDKAIYLLRFCEHTKTHLVEKVGSDQLILIEDAELIARIRNNDLSALLNRAEGSCAFESVDGYHFVTPSLSHTTRFLRIGDLISNKDTLLRFSFWLRSIVSTSNALLIDNWSVVAPVLAAIHQCQYAGTYDCLPEHPATNEEGCRQVILNLTDQIPDGGTLAVIISICGSGRLAKFITQICNSVGEARFNVKLVNLFGFTSSPPDVECWHRIEDKGLTFGPDTCDLCKSGSKPISLDGANYHLRAFVEKPVCLGKRHFKSGKQFIEQYRNIEGAFRLHRNDPNDGRHHAFGLDVGALLTSGSFKDRLIESISSFKGEVDLVVAPQHGAGLKLIEIAAEVLNAPYLLHDTLDRGALLESEHISLATCRRLLILDDVINSGSRLRRYIQSIREGGFNGFDKVHYLAGVARPTSQNELEAHKGSLRDGHSWAGEFRCVETILLPRFNEGDCPWCKEFDFLSRVATDLDFLPEWLTARLTQLRNRDKGLTAEALLLLPGVAERNAGGDSPIFFEGATSISTAFQLASGLQDCRNFNDMEARLAPGFPLGTVLHPDVIAIRYTEGLIRGLLLRLVTRQEWGNTVVTQTRAAFVEAALTKSQDIMAGELLLVFSRQALPALTRSEFIRVFGGVLEGLTERIAELLSLHN